MVVSPKHMRYWQQVQYDALRLMQPLSDPRRGLPMPPDMMEQAMAEYNASLLRIPESIATPVDPYLFEVINQVNQYLEEEEVLGIIDTEPWVQRVREAPHLDRVFWERLAQDMIDVALNPEW